jgi:hypothetical protein
MKTNSTQARKVDHHSPRLWNNFEAYNHSTLRNPASQNKTKSNLEAKITSSSGAGQRGFGLDNKIKGEGEREREKWEKIIKK